MLNTIKLRGLALAAILALPAPLGMANAQDRFPSRAVTLVVPFPPGGSADALPRIVAEKLRERWGQPVIIENRPGAAGSTGSGSVFRAPPDGSTLLATPAGKLQIIDEAAYFPNPEVVMAKLSELEDLYACAFWALLDH